MFVKTIELGSNEYQQALQLRYQLFYQPHGLSFDSIFDIDETEIIHLAIVKHNALLAYGQLKRKKDQEYQIAQMVVHPTCQREGLGKKLLAELIAIARKKNASKIVLDSRIYAVDFYQQLGFNKISEIEHLSTTTGVPHICMQLKL